MQISVYTEVLKEPRGFIKCLEIILAICSFATAVGPHLQSTFVCSCNESTGGSVPIELSFQYPYKLEDSSFKFPKCVKESNESNMTTVPSSDNTYHASGNCKSSSEFYVTIGVIVFLYSLGAVIFYVLGSEQYAGFAIIPKADFVITILFTLFWLISSSVFADAVTKIKTYTNPEWFWNSDDSLFKMENDVTCSSPGFVNYSTLNASVIFGFLNMVVWGGNNWFLYKETEWFGDESSASQTSQPMPASTSQIEPKV